MWSRKPSGCFPYKRDATISVREHCFYTFNIPFFVHSQTTGGSVAQAHLYHSTKLEQKKLFTLFTTFFSPSPLLCQVWLICSSHGYHGDLCVLNHINARIFRTSELLFVSAKVRNVLLEKEA